MKKLEKYHEIFIVFPDTYSLGGPEAFESLTREADDKKDGKNLVVVPRQFIDDLDQVKSKSTGANDALNVLKSLKQKRMGTEGDANVYSYKPGIDIATFISPDEIVSIEKKVAELWGKKPTLITRDAKNHIIFSEIGMNVEDPKFLQADRDIIYEGVIDGNDELCSKLYENNRSIPLEEAQEILGRDLFMNQFIRFAIGQKAEYSRVIGRLKKDKTGSRIIGVDDIAVKMLPEEEHKKVVRLGNTWMKGGVLGISPRDMEQYLAMQYGLMNPDVFIFFLCGAQGSGKTLLSYATGVDLVLMYDKDKRERRGQKDYEDKEGFFKKVILLKPNEIIGGERRDVGFLPGDLYSKIKPHLGSYIDAHNTSSLGKNFAFEDMFRHPKFSNDFGEPRSKEVNERKTEGGAHLSGNCEAIELTYSGFMRGRSISNCFVIIDEAQNYTPYEMKTLLQRLGEGSKCVVMGDPKQLDNPFCSPDFNGLTHSIKHYLKERYSALVTLATNYRSQVSEDTEGWHLYK